MTWRTTISLMIAPLAHKNLLNIKVFTTFIKLKNVKTTLQTRMIMIIIAMRSREVIDSLRKHDIAHIASSII
jgi:predicted lactoylglutathione lyase